MSLFNNSELTGYRWIDSNFRNAYNEEESTYVQHDETVVSFSELDSIEEFVERAKKNISIIF
jgi:hypothetical protein